MRKRIAVSWFGAVVLALTTSFVAQGQEQESNGVLLIMDASGSMNRVDDAGITLIDGAKRSLDQLIDAMPEGTPIGLRVYGHRVQNTDRENGCTDTELIVPVGPLRRDEMQTAIASFDALGFTPIGLSLQEAAEDLGGVGTIVLVSDGEDTCAPPDPCEVAAGLIASGFDLRVETIGFFLDDTAAREQLQCIATATGGTYREVGELDSLAAEMGVLIQQSNPDVGRFHLPLQGGATAIAATPTPLRAPYDEGPDNGYIGAAGSYLTTMEPGVTEWFSIEVAAGRGLLVYGGDPVADAPPSGTIEIEILDPEGNDARRNSPQGGAAVADAAALSAPGEAFLAAGNRTEYQPWEQLEPEMVSNLVAQGYDEESYNREWLAATLAPQEDPPPAGPYSVGITWRTEQDGGQLGLNWGTSITAQPVDIYGQVYERLDGGVDEASATEFETAADVEPFDPYMFPPGEYAQGARSYQIGAVSSGETGWYRQPLEFDEALTVEALAVDADGQPLETGTLDLEIFDSDMNSVGHAVPTTLPIDPTGEASLAAVSMVYDGDGPPPPSSHDGAWLAVTWTSPTGQTADVRMIVDVTARYPNSRAPEPEASRATTAPTDVGDPGSVDDTSEPDGSDGRPIALIGVALLAVAGGVLLVIRHRRSTTSTSTSTSSSSGRTVSR